MSLRSRLLAAAVLLGPLAAMNGMLLFGWSVAVIYDVLRTVTRAMPAAPDAPQ